MKSFEIVYTNIVYVTVEAESEEEAMEKFREDPSSFDVDSIEAFQDPEFNS